MMTEPTASHSVTESHDVVVVGARCAGAATGMLLARSGHDVVVVDRATFPSDTLSTHVIARAGVVQLDRWGLLGAVLESGAPALRELVLHVDGTPIPRTIGNRAGVDLLVAPRRHALDAILLDAARADGADVRTGFTVHDVVREPDGRVLGVVGVDADGTTRTILGRIVVGADGLRSRVARAVGAPVVDERHHDGAVHYAYFAGVDRGALELHFAEGAFAGVFPTHGDEANVWVAGPAAALPDFGRGGARAAGFRDHIGRAFPHLATRLDAGVRTSLIRGYVGMPNQIRQPTGPGWALVGDASYFRDAVSGHGISDAFRDAETLARAIDLALRVPAAAPAALTGYAQARDRSVAELFEVTCRVAQYPPMAEFIDLQRRLTDLIDIESDRLAATPPIPRRLTATAA